MTQLQTDVPLAVVTAELSDDDLEAVVGGLSRAMPSPLELPAAA